MESGPKYTFIVSAVIIVLAAILLVYGSTVAIDVESEAVFKGTEGTVSLSGDTTYTVFVNDEFDCYDTDVVITDGTSDYFNQDCDEIMDEKGWKHAGILPIGTSGDLEVTSNHEIIIVDEMVYLESGGSVIVGACACCLGFIGVIVGAIWSRSSGSGAETQIVVMPQQQFTGTQFQPVGEAYQPTNLIITQQEEEPGA